MVWLDSDSCTRQRHGVRGEGEREGGSVCARVYVCVCVSTRSEEHTSELQSPCNLVCRLLLEKKKKKHTHIMSHIMSMMKEMYSFILYRLSPYRYSRYTIITSAQRSTEDLVPVIAAELPALPV